MTSRDEILDILRKAYQIEVDGYTFYSMTAEKAAKPAVRELFEKLARDEMEHQAYLKAVVKRYDREGSAAFRVQQRAPELRVFADKVFTDRFRSQAQGAAFEVGVLSVGMTLESNAIAHFTRAAEGADDREVRGFYEFLADWEREHLQALQNLYNAVRQDFWQDAGFAPF
jgi:rubrerythrin